MNKIIEALEHMAENGGHWYHGTYAGVWSLDLRYARSGSHDAIRFTQYEAREFLKHYEELMTENQDI